MRQLPQRAITGLALLALGLLTTAACQVVEPLPHAHTEDLPVRQQSTAGLLSGRHAEIACEGCHEGQAPPYAAVADDCLGCHEADRRQRHPLGADHMPEATTCGGAGCHAVDHVAWSDWREGFPDCLLGPSSVGSCSGGCHGETDAYGAPADGAHQVHTDPSVATMWAPDGAQRDCALCHPAGNDEAETHFDCTVDLPLDGVAALGWAADWEKGPQPPPTDGTPTYHPSTMACSNVYCHGYGFADRPDAPVWTDPADGACGSCHGIEPAYAHHAYGNSCGTCHGGTAVGNAPTTISDPAAHVDGILSVYGQEY